MEYLDGPRDGREVNEEARNGVTTKENRIVRRLLLCLRGENLYGHRLEERLGELGLEGKYPGEMYRILWQMEHEGMVFCNREGGGFRVSQRWYTHTEVGEAYLESYAGSLTRYGEEYDPLSLFQAEWPGQGRGCG